MVMALKISFGRLCEKRHGEVFLRETTRMYGDFGYSERQGIKKGGILGRKSNYL